MVTGFERGKRKNIPVFGFISWVFVIAVAFHIFSSEILFSQEKYRNTKVFIIHSAVATRDEHIEGILDKTCLIKTKSFGLSGVSIDSADIPSLVSKDSEKDLVKEAVSELVRREEDADLLLFGRYRVVRDVTTIEYYFFDVQSLTLLASVQREIKIDLYLDRSVSKMLNEIFTGASGKIDQLAETKKAETKKTEDEIREAEKLQPDESPEIKRQEIIPKEKTEKTLVETFGATSLIFFIGEASTHFPLGVYAGGGVLFPVFTGPKTGLSIGISGGYMRLFPSEPNMAEYIRTLVPIGIPIRVAIEQSRLLTWLVTLTGGGVYRVDADEYTSEYLSTMLPYIEIGGGLKVMPLGNRVALTMHASYLCIMNFYRESGRGEVSVDNISGFSPGISLEVRI